MKAAIARITRKLFFIIFLGHRSDVLLWDLAVSGLRTASLDPLLTELVRFNPWISPSVEVQSAAAGTIPSKTDQGPTSAQALANPATEGGSTPGPRFFLLIGLVLIGVRLIISYRSRKVKNLATGTH